MRIEFRCPVTTAILRGLGERVRQFVGRLCDFHPQQQVLVQKLRSPTKPQYLLASGTALRLKNSTDSRTGIETEFFYSCLDSEEVCFKGGRSYRRGRICCIPEEELDEKQLISEMRRVSRVSGWRYY